MAGVLLLRRLLLRAGKMRLHLLGFCAQCRLLLLVLLDFCFLARQKCLELNNLLLRHLDLGGSRHAHTLVVLFASFALILPPLDER